MAAAASAVALAVSSYPVAAAAPNAEPHRVAETTTVEHTDDADPVVVRPMSALGSTLIGTFRYSFKGLTINVPTGCALTHRVDGRDRYISGQFAGVDCIGLAATHPRLFCNTRFDFIYKDHKGQEYRRETGTTNNSCRTQISSYHNKLVPYTATFYGLTCVQFYVNGTQRGEQCHQITKP